MKLRHKAFVFTKHCDTSRQADRLLLGKCWRGETGDWRVVINSKYPPSSQCSTSSKKCGSSGYLSCYSVQRRVSKWHSWLHTTRQPGDNYYNYHIKISYSHTSPHCSVFSLHSTSQREEINFKVGTFEPILSCSDIHSLELLEVFRTSIVIILLLHFQIDLEQIIRTNFSIFSISVSVRTAGVRAPVRCGIAGDGDDWGHLIGQSPCSG